MKPDVPAMSDMAQEPAASALGRLVPRRVASWVRRTWADCRDLAAHLGVRNAGWIGAERIGRMALSLVVGILVVRQLGPDRFGTYSYVLTWASVFLPLALFGIGENTVRHLIGSPAHEGRVLATATVLRTVSCALAAVVTILAFQLSGTHADATTVHLAIAITSLLAYPLLVLEPYFQARSRARTITVCGLGSGLVVAVIKVIGIVSGAPVAFFLAAHALETVLLAVTLLAAYLATTQPPRHWTFDASLARTLCAEALPMVIGGFAVMIYNQSDTLLLGMLLQSPHEVGLYAAACRVSTMWVFVPMAIITSASPFLYRLMSGNDGRYERRLLQLMSLCIGIGYCFCLLVATFPELVLSLLFGGDFAQAGPALRVHVWSNIFSIIGMAQNSWILGRGLLWVALQNTILGAALNVALNLVVIPSYGAVGASWTTVVAMAAATVVAMAVRPSTRELARIQLRSLALGGLLRQRQPETKAAPHEGGTS